MKRSAFIIILISVCFTIIFSCGNKSTNPAPIEKVTTVPIADFRLDNTAVTGWTEPESTFVSGDTSSLCSAIDGACITYIGYGMSLFFRQDMQNASHSAVLIVMDFGTIQAAKSIYAHMKGDEIAFGSHSPDTVVCTKTNYYLTVYARMNKYYFELSFAFGADPSDTAALAAAQTEVEAGASSIINRYQTVLKVN